MKLNKDKNKYVNIREFSTLGLLKKYILPTIGTILCFASFTSCTNITKEEDVDYRENETESNSSSYTQIVEIPDNALDEKKEIILNAEELNPTYIEVSNEVWQAFADSGVVNVINIDGNIESYNARDLTISYYGVMGDVTAIINCNPDNLSENAFDSEKNLDTDQYIRNQPLSLFAGFGELCAKAKDGVVTLSIDEAKSYQEKISNDLSDGYATMKVNFGNGSDQSSNTFGYCSLKGIHNTPVYAKENVASITR